VIIIYHKIKRLPISKFEVLVVTDLGNKTDDVLEIGIDIEGVLEIDIGDVLEIDIGVLEIVRESVENGIKELFTLGVKYNIIEPLAPLPALLHVTIEP